MDSRWLIGIACLATLTIFAIIESSGTTIRIAEIPQSFLFCHNVIFWNIVGKVDCFPRLGKNDSPIVPIHFRFLCLRASNCRCQRKKKQEQSECDLPTFHVQFSSIRFFPVANCQFSIFIIRRFSQLVNMIGNRFLTISSEYSISILLI